MAALLSFSKNNFNVDNTIKSLPSLKKCFILFVNYLSGLHFCVALKAVLLSGDHD